ncbi:MAG: hypothetical protein WD598_05340 [Acidimicrobiia bacterium]
MTERGSGPRLRAITPDATPEEVAAILAAVTVSTAGGPPMDHEPHLDEWVRGARLVSRRVGRVRGPWRFSGRVARRTRP